jgi:hypothetical protein
MSNPTKKAVSMFSGNHCPPAFFTQCIGSSVHWAYTVASIPNASFGLNSPVKYRPSRFPVFTGSVALLESIYRNRQSIPARTVNRSLGYHPHRLILVPYVNIEP